MLINRQGEEKAGSRIQHLTRHQDQDEHKLEHRTDKEQHKQLGDTMLATRTPQQIEAWKWIGSSEYTVQQLTSGIHVPFFCSLPVFYFGTSFVQPQF